ncbi:MAG: hypothetical protein CMJ49_02310 [Planctomycetaceae bacterium]|nr:hypothetical protein [Planctomycetaceae bacterium]
MAKRQRRPVQSDAPQDPLSNYDPTDYDDALERSLCEDDLRDIMSHPAITATPDTATREVVNTLHDRAVACVIIVDDGRPVGILTERDVLNYAAAGWDDVKDKPVSGVMTRDPVTLHDSDTPARALNAMASGGIRHIPVTDIDGKLVGMIGIRRITRYLQQHLSEAADPNASGEA